MPGAVEPVTQTVSRGAGSRNGSAAARSTVLADLRLRSGVKVPARTPPPYLAPYLPLVTWSSLPAPARASSIASTPIATRLASTPRVHLLRHAVTGAPSPAVAVALKPPPTPLCLALVAVVVRRSHRRVHTWYTGGCRATPGAARPVGSSGMAGVAGSVTPYQAPAPSSCLR